MPALAAGGLVAALDAIEPTPTDPFAAVPLVPTIPLTLPFVVTCMVSPFPTGRQG